MSFHPKTFQEALQKHKPLRRKSPLKPSRNIRTGKQADGVENASGAGGLRRGAGLKRVSLKRYRPRAGPTEDGDSAKKIKFECDDLIRQILKVRDKKCFTCPATSDLQVGHLFRRGIERLRWSLENNHLQCPPCNSRHEYEPDRYHDEFKRQFGLRALARLEQRTWERGKLTYLELLTIRDHLRDVRNGTEMV